MCKRVYFYYIAWHFLILFHPEDVPEDGERVFLADSDVLPDFVISDGRVAPGAGIFALLDHLQYLYLASLQEPILYYK